MSVYASKTTPCPACGRADCHMVGSPFCRGETVGQLKARFHETEWFTRLAAGAPCRNPDDADPPLDCRQEFPGAGEEWCLTCIARYVVEKLGPPQVTP